ncbi:hypothetical protein KW835_14115 [Acidovorax sp. sic0104]|nr:hypothetical protein [Acidovorax sp. sic0104]
MIRLGVEAVLVESDLDECNHIFLKLLDGEILDPTADQFNEGSRVQLPEVYLGPGARIHTGAQPWAGGLEWGPFMEEIQRLVPSLAPDKVGRAVGLLLRSFPGRLEPARAPNQASL